MNMPGVASVATEEAKPYTFGPKPDVAPETMGRLAVTLDIKTDLEELSFMGVAEETDADLPSPSEQLEESSDEFFRRRRLEVIDEQLADIQSRLTELDDDESAVFDSYCEVTPVSGRLLEAKRQSAPNSTWAEWLGTAEKPQILSFLHWHVRAIEALGKDPRVVEEIQRERAEYKAGIKQGVADGWVHPHALDFFLSRVDEASVYVGDIFNTDFRNMGGYCVRDWLYVVIGKGSVPSPENGYENLLVWMEYRPTSV